MDIRKTREELRKGKTIFDMPLNVCYYARVSTDKDDQLNSLENQQKYFEDYIEDNLNWKNLGGYIDEGISGTAVKNRDSFLRMIEDATLGKIDLILTKEISRFSRNTVDSIKYTEYLLKNGVIVYFLSDNLNTIQEDAEFRLTIMASLAQDEVRKLSERVKFGVNRMIKDGKLLGGGLTGYYKKDGKYEINPNESPIVEYLFTSYASGNMSFKKISQELAKMGYLNTKGQPYSDVTLSKFLTNPRYKGYYTARLSEVEDYKTHKKKPVPKERQIIYKDDKIPAIVSEELWDKANLLHENRKKIYAHNTLNSDESLKKSKYTRKLYCKDCGTIFIRNSGTTRANRPVWSCKNSREKGVKSCVSPIIPERYLDDIFVKVFDDLIENKKKYFDMVKEEYMKIIETTADEFDVDDLKAKISVLDKQKDKLLDLSIKGLIGDSEFKKRNDKFNDELMLLQNKLKNYTDTRLEEDRIDKKLKELNDVLNDKLDVRKNLPYLVKLLIEKVVIEKVNGNRKHVRLDIYFDFCSNSISIDMDMQKKVSVKELCSCKINTSDIFNTSKCACTASKEHRVC